MSELKPDPLMPPIVIDTREQKAFTFEAFGQAFNTITATLPTGDYSLLGFESRIVIERKSLADLYGTLGQGRARFIRELERMQAIAAIAEGNFAGVIVEEEISTVLASPPAYSKLHPRSVMGSILSWQVRYPGVHWAFMPGRSVAEVWTAKVLKQWWEQRAANF